MPELLTTDADEPKKKSLIATILMPVLLLVLSGGLGFSFSKFYVSPIIDEAVAAVPADTMGSDTATMIVPAPKQNDHTMTVVELDPILTNLSDPSDVWVRAEFSVLFNGQPTSDVTAEIESNFLRYMKTVKLRNLEGAIGFEHMLADLNERAHLISGGEAGRVLVKAFIVQ